MHIDAPHTKRLHTIRAIEDQSVVDELHQKGKSVRETRTSGGESMGGAISKSGDTVDEVIDIYGQSPVAAAASSVLYSGGYGDDSADSNESPSGKADCDEDDDYILDRLIFSNDEDFLVDIDSESEDERLRSSFPKDPLVVYDFFRQTETP